MIYFFFFLTILAAAVLLLFIRYKKEGTIQKTLVYKNTFSSRQPLVYFFLYLLYPMVSVGFFIMLITAYPKQELPQKILYLALIVLCIGILFFGIWEMLTFFPRQIRVNQNEITITNSLNRTYTLSPEQLTNFSFRRFQRYRQNTIYVEFVDKGGKKHVFSMHMHYRPYLLMQEWIRRHAQQFYLK